LCDAPRRPLPAATPPPSVVETSSAAAKPTAPAVAPIQPVSAADLGPSWRPGCPVDPRQLRRVEINYLGFDGKIHRGELIVHEDLSAEVVAIFEQLLQLRYPIEKIRTVDNYPGADDELSMENNNTSAFSREIRAGRWYQHSFGRAIDLNPLLNPYIDRTGAFQPKNVVGAGAATGELLSTISTSSDDRRHTTLHAERAPAPTGALSR
jgi:hypothetical protein